METELSTRGTLMDGFFLQAHADLSLCLTEGYTHSDRRMHIRKVLKALNEMARSHS
jgi:hypothetical protein